MSRLLFIAAMPKRFHPSIFAEMRGFIDENNNSPFWDGVGRHFLNIDFQTLIAWRDREISVIPEILPKHPLYVPLLNEDARKAIGRVHYNTEPALHLLKKQGFAFTKEIDLYDAGPRIMATQSHMPIIQHSHVEKVFSIQELPPTDAPVMLCNNRLDFRACFGEIDVDKKGHLVLDHGAAELLKVKVGENIRYVRRNGS